MVVVAESYTYILMLCLLSQCFAFNQVSYVVTSAFQYRAFGVRAILRWVSLAASFFTHLFGLATGLLGVLSVVTRNRAGRHRLATNYLIGLVIYGVLYLATFLFSYVSFLPKISVCLSACLCMCVCVCVQCQHVT